jgi:hypothetical protein
MRSERPSSSGSSEETTMTPFPCVGQPLDDPVDLVLRPHVDAAGGLVEDEQLGLGEEPLGEDDLLLVATGELGHPSSTFGVLVRISLRYSSA